MSLLLIGTLAWLSFAVLALSLGRAAKVGDKEERARAQRAATRRGAWPEGGDLAKARLAERPVADGRPASALLETRPADAA